MSRMKEIVTAAGTLVCALGIGFVMQSGDTAKKRYGPQAQNVQQAPAAGSSSFDVQIDASGTSAAGVVQVQDVILTSAIDDTPTPMIKAMGAETITKVVATALQAPEKDAVPAATPETCLISASGSVKPAAMLAVSLEAPCLPQEHVTVHHNGLMFTSTTDADGNLSFDMPALAGQAVVIFAFRNGEGAVASVAVPDIDAVSRVAVQWSGQGGFELHAREFGASYGSDGHVWRNAPRVISAKASAGFLTSLGDAGADNPMLAEIYTFPAAYSARNGQIDLSVEAEVTAANCGLEVEAQTLEMREYGRLRTQNITLSVPGCDAIGDFLVLNNLLEDLKIAAR